MYTISNDLTSELIIKKSKFITKLIKMNNSLEVKKIINNLKKEYPNANHYCYAYIINNNIKVSDDGEPSKTAGMPILNVLTKKDLNNILCVVIRYFGGVKLGANGLIRAYSNSVIASLESTSIIPVSTIYKIRIETDYNKVNILNNLLKDAKIVYKEFDISILYEIKIEESLFNNLEIELKNNMIKYEIIEKEIS